MLLVISELKSMLHSINVVARVFVDTAVAVVRGGRGVRVVINRDYFWEKIYSCFLKLQF